jgi:hypothetical protein
MSAKRRAHKRHQFTVEKLLKVYSYPLGRADVGRVMENNKTGSHAEAATATRAFRAGKQTLKQREAPLDSGL